VLLCAWALVVDAWVGGWHVGRACYKQTSMSGLVVATRALEHPSCKPQGAAGACAAALHPITLAALSAAPCSDAGFASGNAWASSWGAAWLARRVQWQSQTWRSVCTKDVQAAHVRFACAPPASAPSVPACFKHLAPAQPFDYLASKQQAALQGGKSAGNCEAALLGWPPCPSLGY